MRTHLVGRPMPDAAAALDAVSGRLRDAGVVDLVTGAGQGAGWQALPEALDDLQRWHAELADRHGDRRAAAASLAAWVAGTPSLVVGIPAIVGGVVSDVEAWSVRLHRHPQGFVDRYAIAPSQVHVGSDEGVVAAAERVARLTAPLVERLSDELPIGPVALWGGVADVLGAHTLWFARQSGSDQRRAWSRAQALLDRLVQVAPVRHRPRLFPVAWSGGTDHYSVRGTCCLYYRTDAAVDADPASPTYCATCPLRGDDSRTARLVAHLESTS